MPYYQEGHNGTVESYQSAQIPWKIFYSPLCLLGRIYPTKLDIFIGSQKHGNTARLDISDQPNLSGLHRFLEPWQLPRSDISDPSNLSGLHRVPVLCHPPRPDISDLAKLSHFKFPNGHIRSRSDIFDALTPPTVINVWGL
jgi:hypothetical protein